MAASTVIGAMTVNVNANTREFARKMRAVQQQVQATAAKVKQHSDAMDEAIRGNAMAVNARRNKQLILDRNAAKERALAAEKSRALYQRSVAAAAASLVAVTAIIGAFRKLVNVIAENANELDKFQKTMQKLGVSSEGLGGLQLAASLTGVSVETMNMALQRMTRRVAEAAKGTGEAKNALKELGIDARELVQLPLEVQFQQISLAMEKVGTRADKVRLAMKLFDSEGVALVNTLDLGEKGLKRLAAESVVLGTSVSGDNLKKVTAMNDELKYLSAAFTGAKSRFTIWIAPEASQAIRLLSETIKYAGRGGLGDVLFQVISPFSDVFRDKGRPSYVQRMMKKNVSAKTRAEEDAARNAMNERGIAKLGAMPTKLGLDAFAEGLKDKFKDSVDAAKPFLAGFGDAISRQTIGGNVVRTTLERQKRDFEKLKAQQPLGQNSDILERGTAAGRAALRANLNKTDDKHLKLAEKAQEHRVELIEAVKKMFVPSVASI